MPILSQNKQINREQKKNEKLQKESKNRLIRSIHTDSRLSNINKYMNEWIIKGQQDDKLSL